MPVKIWEKSGSETVSRVVTEWERSWTSEEYRAEADELDQMLDHVLDAAVRQTEEYSGESVPEEFMRAWAIGRQLRDSGVLNSPALLHEERRLLWRALARKCRLGTRADGSIEPRWSDLRPQRLEEPRREGGKLDYFAMCLWLGEQDLPDAAATFGGSIRNVWQMQERPTLRPLSVRQALLDWFNSLPEEVAEESHGRAEFAELMKALRARWPDRGRGSAKRPIHYSDEDLRTELFSVLRPFARLGERTDTPIPRGAEREP